MGSAGDSSGLRWSSGTGRSSRVRPGGCSLRHDSNDVLAQHTGRLLFSARELEEWRYLLETRRLWLADRGARYGFLVPPNSHTVHADKLPRHPLSDVRPVTQLLDLVDFMPIVYPLEELRAEPRALLRSWTRTGASWARSSPIGSSMRGVGAARARPFRAQLLGAGGVRRPGRRRRRRRVPARASLRGRAGRARACCTTTGGGLRPPGRARVRRPGCACLVFGDSYSYAMLPFLAESFTGSCSCNSRRWTSSWCASGSPTWSSASSTSGS